jgi:hypothetical protein
VTVGRQGYGFAAVDPAADLVYVSNYLDDTVSVINGSTCSGTNTSGCKLTPPTVHTIVLTRASQDPATRAYIARRTAEGKTMREIKRCLKRYIARQLYRELERTTAGG